MSFIKNWGFEEFKMKTVLSRREDGVICDLDLNINPILQNFLKNNRLFNNFQDGSIVTHFGWEYKLNNVILKMNNQRFPLDINANYAIEVPLGIITKPHLFLTDNKNSYHFSVM